MNFVELDGVLQGVDGRVVIHVSTVYVPRYSIPAFDRWIFVWWGLVDDRNESYVLWKMK